MALCLKRKRRVAIVVVIAIALAIITWQTSPATRRNGRPSNQPALNAVKKVMAPKASSVNVIRAVPTTAALPTNSSSPESIQPFLLDDSVAIGLHKLSDHVAEVRADADRIHIEIGPRYIRTLVIADQNVHLVKTGTIPVFPMYIFPTIRDESSRDIGSSLGIYKPVTTRRMALIFETIAKQPNARHRQFLDVGAGVGYFSLLARAHGINSIAIEAYAENAAILKENVYLRSDAEGNAIERDAAEYATTNKPRAFIRPIVAVLDKDAGRPVVVAGSSMTKHDVEFLKEGEEPTDKSHRARPQSAMETVTLDSLLPGVHDIIAAKINANGNEMRIIQGARRLFNFYSNPLDRTPCFVFIRFDPILLTRAGSNPKEFLEILTMSGYAVYTDDMDARTSRSLTPQSVITRPTDLFLIMRRSHCASVVKWLPKFV